MTCIVGLVDEDGTGKNICSCCVEACMEQLPLKPCAHSPKRRTGPWVTVEITDDGEVKAVWGIGDNAESAALDALRYITGGVEGTWGWSAEDPHRLRYVQNEILVEPSCECVVSCTDSGDGNVEKWKDKPKKIEGRWCFGGEGCAWFRGELDEELGL